MQCEARLIRSAAIAAAIAAMATVLLVPARVANSVTITPFAPRFTANENGALIVIGNNSLTCVATNPNCASARNGTATGAASSNNAYEMVNIDLDADAGTYNSTNANLVISSGATVLFAGLYWGAKVTAGTRGAVPSTPITQVLFRAPSDASFRTVTSSQQHGPTSDGAFQQFADVTSIVRSAGAGTYWAANVPAATGEDRYGGWALVVAYRDPTMPLRNLTVFDGFSDIAPNSDETINMQGFLAPLTGTVETRVGLVAYEGDRGGTGDAAFLNQTRLATSSSPGTNFFNGTNDLDGVNVTTRQPADANMLGFDIIQLGVPNTIPNGATSATMTLTTNAERYFIGVVTTSIDLYAPDLTTSRKTVTNLSGHTPALVGDTLEYTMTFANTGMDPAAAVVGLDFLGAGNNFVPGSIEVVTGDNAGPKTDATLDNQAEYVPVLRAVRFRLGNGASGTSGGVLAPGTSTTVRFRATIGPSAIGTTVTNQAGVTYRAQTLGQTLVYTTNQTRVDVEPNADLRIAKVTTPDPAFAGGTITSTITVTNDGPNPAVAAIVSDTLSPGVTLVSVSPPQLACVTTGLIISCPLGTLAVGASANVTITVTTPSSSTLGSFTNIARTTSGTRDPDPADNTAAATVQILQRADLAIAKSSVPETVAPGELVTFPISVTNLGPSDATNVVVSDDLDQRLTEITVPAPCTLQGSSVSCSFGSLTAGAQTPPVAITARVASSVAPGTLTNSAVVAAQTPDVAVSNNTGSATTTIGPPSADLVVTKTVAPTSVVAGGTATYTINVRNNGPSDAAGVALSDPLAPGLTPSSVTTSRGSCTPGVVACAIGTLPAGATATVTVQAAVAPDTPVGAIGNVASVTAIVTDPNPANNTGTVALNVSAQADLTIIKSGGPNPVVPGEQMAYQIDVGNAGPSTAQGIVVTDTLPPGMTFSEFLTLGASCSPPVGNTFTCNFDDLSPGDFGEVVLVLDVPTDFDDDTVVNTASVTASTPDPNTVDNDATLTFGTGAQADLSIEKEATSPLVAGDLASWTLHVINNGPSAAEEVVVTDTLPIELVDPVLPPGCSLDGSEITCSLGTVGVSAQADVTISGRVPTTVSAGTLLTNRARVTSLVTPDPSSSSNEDVITQSVSELADLVVTKTTDTPVAPAGAGLPTFTITVHNDGPSIARDVRVSDTLPFAAVIEEVTGGTCDVSGVTVDCVVTDLAPGDEASVVISYFTRTSVVPGPYTNSATASTSTPDPDLVNNTDGETVTVLSAAVDVTVVKSGQDMVAGDRFDYTIDVQNNGPSTAFDVVVTDTLPPGLTPDVATRDFGTCSISAQTVTCNLEFVYEPPFQSFNAPIHISGTVDPDAASRVGNVAVATTVETDIDPTNNSAITFNDIARQVDVSVVKQADSTTAVPGTAVGYTLVVTNAGPSVAPGVVITETLPAAVAFDRDATDSSCVAPFFAGDPLVCLLGNLGVGESRVLRIAGTLDPTFLGPVLTNTAFISSLAATDVDPTNDSATVTLPVQARADLVVDKTAGGESIIAGGLQDFRVSVSNEGPSVARSVQLQDLLPNELDLVSVAVDPARPCTGALVCDLGDIAPGDTVSLMVTLRAPPSLDPGVIVNTASASSSTPDADQDDNASSVSLGVVLEANVSGTKTLLTDPVIAGQPVTYQITISNAGPSDARNVTVIDPLPAGTSLASGLPANGNCAETDIDGVTTVNCLIPILTAGETRTRTLTLNTSPSLTGELINTLIVGAAALDRADANNSSTAEAIVQQLPPVTAPTTPSTTPGTAPSTTTTTTAPQAPPPPAPRGLPATGGQVIEFLAVAAAAIAVGGLARAVTTRKRPSA